MNKIYILLITLFSISSNSQSSTRFDFENLKNYFEKNPTAINAIGLDDSCDLNVNEIEILKILNNNLDYNFKNKKIAFVGGSLGTTISSKSNFFKTLKYYCTKHKRIISYTIKTLNKEQKIKSNFDVIVFFWVKTHNENSKKLLNRLKKNNCN